MKKAHLSRRTFLRGAGGAAVSLPLMASGLGAVAQDPTSGGVPKRFVVVFIPNGVQAETWFPTSVRSDRDFTFGPTMEPLARHRERLMVLGGLSLKSRVGLGDEHQNGMGAVLTGRPLLEGDFRGGGTAGPSGWASGISVDQRIAQHIGTDTRLRSIELGIFADVGSFQNRKRMSYTGPAQPVTPIDDPGEAWARMFSDFSTDSSELDRIRRRRGSVLDSVLEQHRLLGQQLARQDAQRLDQHAELIRRMERRLDLLGVVTCEPPTRPGVELSSANIPDISRAHIDMIVSALACDVTRVASLMFSNASGNYRMPFEPVNSDSAGHDLGHSAHVDDAEGIEFDRRVRWTMGELAYLLDELEAVPEADGSLLDNTLVLLVSENANPHHKTYNMPFLLAGNVAGRFEMNRYLQYDDHTHNDLLVSLQNAFGVEDTSFGLERYCNGPLSGLTA